MQRPMHFVSLIYLSPSVPLSVNGEGEAAAGGEVRRAARWNASCAL
jgi:hypothetical protein